MNSPGQDVQRKTNRHLIFELGVILFSLLNTGLLLWKLTSQIPKVIAWIWVLLASMHSYLNGLGINKICYVSRIPRRVEWKIIGAAIQSESAESNVAQKICNLKTPDVQSTDYNDSHLELLLVNKYWDFMGDHFAITKVAVGVVILTVIFRTVLMLWSIGERVVHKFSQGLSLLRCRITHLRDNIGVALQTLTINIALYLKQIFSRFSTLLQRITRRALGDECYHISACDCFYIYNDGLDEIIERGRLCQQLHGDQNRHDPYLQQAVKKSHAEIDRLLQRNSRLQQQNNNLKRLFIDRSQEFVDTLDNETLQSVERKSKERKRLLKVCSRLMRTVERYHPEGPFPVVKFELKDPRNFFRGVDLPENDGGYEIAMIVKWLMNMFELVEQKGWMHEQLFDGAGAQAIRDSFNAAKSIVVASLEEFKQNIPEDEDVFEGTWTKTKSKKVRLEDEDGRDNPPSIDERIRQMQGRTLQLQVLLKEQGFPNATQLIDWDTLKKTTDFLDDPTELAKNKKECLWFWSSFVSIFEALLAPLSKLTKIQHEINFEGLPPLGHEVKEEGEGAVIMENNKLIAQITRLKGMLIKHNLWNENERLDICATIVELTDNDGNEEELRRKLSQELENVNALVQRCVDLKNKSATEDPDRGNSPPELCKDITMIEIRNLNDRIHQLRALLLEQNLLHKEARLDILGNLLQLASDPITASLHLKVELIGEVQSILSLLKENGILDWPPRPNEITTRNDQRGI